MRRLLALVTWSLIGTAAQADDGPPPVLPPAVEAPVVESSAELPPPLESSADLPPPVEPAPMRPEPPARDHGPVLVIPGVTVPRAVQRTPTSSNPGGLARPGSTDLEPVDTLPPLVGPAEMPRPRSAPVPGRMQGPSSARLGRQGLPPTIESEPFGPDEVVPSPRSSPSRSSTSTPSPAARRTNPPSSSPPAPQRRQGGLFGRLFPTAPPDRGTRTSRDEITVEPRNDPDADAATRRRIERQIRDQLGSRLRSVDVRVVGKDVTIDAQTSRFWQRRGVRNALESLPALNGYRARILVDE